MKRILITGASSGIGQAVAELYAQQGEHVIACGRNAEALAKLAYRYVNLEIRQFDTSDAEAVKTELADLGELDIAILNAGTCEYVDVDAFDSALFERVYQVNLMGTVYCLEAVLPALKQGSHLAFTGSLARHLPFTNAAAYGSSKVALHYLARSLETDLAGRGIRVQTISPGFVDTPLARRNTFEMPMLCSVEQAAEAIVSGIKKGKRDIRFPTAFALFLNLLGMLPQGLQVTLARHMKG